MSEIRYDKTPGILHVLHLDLRLFDFPISLLFVILNVYLPLIKGVPVESHQSKLVGSRGSSTRYFDFEKLAEVHSFYCFLFDISTVVLFLAQLYG